MERKKEGNLAMGNHRALCSRARSGRRARSSMLIGLIFVIVLVVGTGLPALAERGYQPRDCGFDMNRDGIIGGAEDCNVCNGGPLDGDADGSLADVIYVSCANDVFSGQPEGFDHPGCGSPGDPCRSIEYAFASIADGPADGAEDIVCFRNTCVEESLSPRSDGGGVPGTFVRTASGSEARDWLLPADPVMLVGWDVDGDGVYPPHDPDHAAVLAPPETCPGSPNQGCGLDPIKNPEDSQQRFHQKIDERAIFLANDLSHVEMAHFTVRDYGRHTLTYNSGFFQLHAQEPGGPGASVPTEYVYVHDVEIHDLNRDSNFNSRASTINSFGWQAHYVAFENLLIADNGHWFVRGGGGNGPTDYGPFRWQNISLTLDACRPPASVSCDPATDPTCASGGVCLSTSGCEPTPAEVCTTRASTSVKVWGYYHGLEILDSVFDANVLSHPNPVPGGLPRGINARQCTQDWTLRNNELIDFNVPIEITPESTGFCDGKKDSSGAITRLDARPVTDIVIDRNLIRHPAPTGAYDVGIALREGGSAFPRQVVGDVTITNNVITSRQGFEQCIHILAGHGYTGSDPAYPPSAVPGAVQVVNNTCWGPITTTGAILIGDGQGANQPYLQQNISLRNNVVAGISGSTQNVMATYAPSGFDAATNVWDPGAGFRFDATSGSIDLAAWIAQASDTGAKACTPQLLHTDGTYSDGDPRPVDGDVHWLPTDLCAQDAGTDASAVTAWDLDGESRPQGNGWDAGADEAAPPGLDDPPLRFLGAPTGALASGTTETTVSLRTYHPATCDAADAPGIAHGGAGRQAMTADAAGTAHELVLTGLVDGSVVARHVRCQGLSGPANDDDFTIAFEVAAAPVVVASQWAFDEGSGCVADDASAEGFDGTLLPGCPGDGPTHIAGIVGQALDFDGADDYLEVAHAEALAFTSSFTVAAWIRPTSFGGGGYGRILAKQQYVGGFGPGYSFYLADQPSGNPAAVQTLCANIDTAIGCADNGTITPGVWQHVTLVFDDVANEVRFFVDGQPRGGFDTTVALRASTVPLRIGDRDDLARSFAGAIDEVRLFGRVLGAGEITSLAVAGGAAPVRSQGSPGGTLPAGTTAVTLSVQTDVSASCDVAGTPGVPFGDPSRQAMTADSAGTTHSLDVAGLVDGSAMTHYIRCQTAGVANDDDFLISFQIAVAAGGSDAFWPFDQASGCTAADTVGTHDGTLFPTCPADGPTWIEGVRGSALFFDGSNDYVEVSHHDDLTFTSSLTLAAWIRPVGFGDGGYGRILAKQQYVGGFGPGYSFYLGDRSTGAPAAVRTLCANIDTAIGCADDGILTPDVWQHVALVFDDAADEVRFFLNGVDQGGFSTGVILRPSTVPLRIGDRDDLARSFHGSIDEVRAWGRALSSLEIADLAALAGQPAVRSQGSPQGSLPAGTNQATLALATHKAATCRYADTPGIAYADMDPNATFGTSDGLVHVANVPVVDDQLYRFYVRCTDTAGVVNDDDFEIAFSVGFDPASLPGVVFFVESRHGFTRTHGSDLADFENYCERTLFPAGCVRRWQDRSGYVRPGRPDFVGRDFGQDDAEKPGLIPNCINGWSCVRGGSQDQSPNLAQDFTFEIEAADHVRDLPGALSIYLLARPVAQTSSYAYFGFAGSALSHLPDDSLALKIDGQAQGVTGPGALIADGAFHLIEIHRDGADRIRLLVDGADLTLGDPVLAGGFDFSFLLSEARLGNMFGDLAAFLLVDGGAGSDEGAMRGYFATVYGVPGNSGPVPPVRSDGNPSGTLPVGTTGATLSVRTDRAALCNVADVAGIDYADPSRQTMTADAAGTFHSFDVVGLSDGQSVERFVRCQADGAANGSDFVIAFQVAAANAGLDAFWPFDEGVGCTTLDAVSSHDATLSPACTGDAPTWIGGVIGSGLDFDGSNDYVEVPHHADLAYTGSFTVSAWIRPADFGDSSYGRILAKQRYVGGFGPGYSFYAADRPAGNPAAVRTLCANIDTAIGCADDDALTLGVWQHVALVFDDAGNQVRFYVDGQPRGGFSTATTLRASAVPLRIGDRDDLARSFHGAIDEVGLWGRALSDGEVGGLAGLMVTTLDDTVAADGETSLREAVDAINGGTFPAGTAVVFDPELAGTVRLSHPSGTLRITESMSLWGDGRITLSGDADDDGQLAAGDVTVLEIDAPGRLVHLDGLRVTGGWAQAFVGTVTAGGGIFVHQGQAVIEGCTFEGNRGGSGGGVGADELTEVTIRDSVFVGNHGDIFAGGVFNNRATVVIEGSRLTGNTSGFNAGALYAVAGVQTTLRNSTLADNQAAFHFGGLLATGGVIDVENSTISGNTADRVGGGLGILGATATITQTTISGNQSVDPVHGGGGGIYVDLASQVTITHSTLAANAAGAAGGGLRVLGGTVSVGHTVFAEHSADLGSGADGPDVAGAITSLGYNLFGQAVVAGSVAADLVGTAAGLGPLADHGGPTFTHLPGAGSAVIDAGDPAFAAPPADDQRGSGFPRIADGDGSGTARVDIGAVEVP